MEYLLSIKTKNNVVQFIINKKNILYDSNYLKNLSEVSEQRQNILGKDYIIISDYIDVDGSILMEYLNNDYGCKLNLDLLKTMLYFMDPRTEKFVQNNLSEILSNKYDKELNILLYLHFEYLLSDIMIIKKLEFDENEGQFIEYNLDPLNYKGEILGYTAVNSIGKFCTSSEINIINYGGKYKNKVLIGTIELSYYSEFILKPRKGVIFYGSEFQINYEDNNSLSISYPLKMGLISKIFLYLYELDDKENIIKINKYNINIKKVFDRETGCSMADRIINQLKYNFNTNDRIVINTSPKIKTIERISNFDLPFEVNKINKFSLEIDFIGSPNY